MLWLKILIGFLNYTYERVAWLPVCLAANSKLCSKLSKFKRLQYENNSRIGCRDIQFNIFQFCKVFQVFLAVAITQYGVVLFHITRSIHDPSMQDLSINYRIFYFRISKKGRGGLPRSSNCAPDMICKQDMHC